MNSGNTLKINNMQAEKTFVLQSNGLIIFKQINGSKGELQNFSEITEDDYYCLRVFVHCLRGELDKIQTNNPEIFGTFQK